MMKDLFPPAAIGSAIVCGCMLLPVFAVLHRVVPRLRESASRLGASFVVVSGLWVLALAGAHVAGLAITVADVAAGVALLVSAAICAFLVISLLAWGFTISIARDLVAAGKPLSNSEWRAAFADGTGFDSFANDRIGLISALGVAVVRGDRLRLTARGRVISRLARIGMVYFGVERIKVIS